MTCGLRVLTVVLMVLAVGPPAATAHTAMVVGTVQVQPLEVELGIEGPADVGERVSATATIRNHGSARLNELTVTLRTPDGLVLSPRPERRIHNLRGGGSRSVRWRVCAQEPGAYGMLAQVEATLPGGQHVTVESPTQLLEVTDEGGSPCP